MGSSNQEVMQTNYASVIEFVSEFIDNCGQVDVMYTDFQKINHKILMEKMRVIRRFQ